MKTLSVMPKKEHPFVRGMSPEHMHRLLAGATVTEFDEGEIIFREGDPAGCI